MNIQGITASGSTLSGAGMINSESITNNALLSKEMNEVESFQDALLKASQEAAASGEGKKLLTACQEFEQYFIDTMFKEMRKTVSRSENSLIPTSPAEDYFQQMLDEEYSKQATNAGGIGLAKFLYAQLSAGQSWTIE
jgi:flagellar protein FlgJ